MDAPSFDIGTVLPDISCYGSDEVGQCLHQRLRHARRSVVFIAGNPESSAVRRQLTALNQIAGKLRSMGVPILAVTDSPPSDLACLGRALTLDMALLSDRSSSLAGPLSQVSDGQIQARRSKSETYFALVTDSSARIEARFGPGLPGKLADPIAGHCLALSKADRPLEAGAPVLQLANLLTRDHCRTLIDYWRKGDKFEGGVANRDRGNAVLNTSIKRRADILLPDSDAIAQDVFSVLREKLVPAVEAYYGFRITHSESLRIGCYASADKGHFRAHRDNSSDLVAFRRFALSLNLNAGEYEGGALVFSEYQDAVFAPPAGSGIVFPCALMHEAGLVTAGARFALFGFFFGAADELRRHNAGNPVGPHFR